MHAAATQVSGVGSFQRCPSLDETCSLGQMERDGQLGFDQVWDGDG